MEREGHLSVQTTLVRVKQKEYDQGDGDDEHLDKSGVLEILCQFFNVQHNAVWRIDYDRQV